MLVDINFIKKKKRPPAYLIWLGGALVIFLLVTLLLFLHASNLQQNNAKLEQSIASVRAEIQAEKDTSAGTESEEAYTQLNDALLWLENYPYSTVLLLEHIAGLLPERGYILDFTLSNEGSVNLTAIFESNRQTAYYLKELKDSKFIKEVELKSVSTSKLEDSGETLPRYISNYVLTLDIPQLRNTSTPEVNDQ
jgi:type IV pilus assembly protein PilN